MKFTCNLQLEGKTATGLLVPESVVDALGTSRRPAVVVTLNGHSYRSSIAVRGDRFLIPVSAEIRKITGVSAGDEVEADVVLDTTPREIVVPDDLAELLAKDAVAAAFFGGLSYSNQRGLVDTIEQAKTEETRLRRLDKTITSLREGRRR
ncbi:hypothetical protein ABIB25_005205 [Nakamurella sp. UYEF19]|uniref:YdeI/OmpD-associated family protein n=1 Tax=Nakamurella sp. UYEF19 TaxID=1756392 RepID=UPI0033919475